MAKNIVIFDIETQRSFEEVGGRDNLNKLGISVLGAYLYSSNEYVIFEEKELPEFEKILQKKPLLVGFNSKKFDCTVLQPYMNFNLKLIPQFDILEEISNTLGHRLSLDSIAKATLKVSKIGSGLDALKYWANGEIDKLKKYCLKDVEITKNVYEYGAANGYLLYTSKYGNTKARVNVNWKVAHPDEKCHGYKQQSLF
ncbi:MAG: helicase [Deltaproteobacteria bacterium CG07_land_8_20_14_0_80_38_7]|nr:MAG: helicase [Deltaproteobacteria bacterium CG07_land_8_20_14_0_80_38_7]